MHKYIVSAFVDSGSFKAELVNLSDELVLQMSLSRAQAASGLGVELFWEKLNTFLNRKPLIELCGTQEGMGTCYVNAVELDEIHGIAIVDGELDGCEELIVQVILISKYLRDLRVTLLSV